MENARRRLNDLGKHLDAVGPRKVLQRGYSYTLGPDGRVLRTPGDVKSGDTLTTHLAGGQIRSVVDGTPGKSPRPKRRNAPGSTPGSAPGLFGG